ncbi:phage protein Gp37 [Aquitalea aquatica]|uniref:DUF1834 family protein n=1 Tax=Aquitalea aquatica TaxID=3044273 RepID=A0A838YG41_9NEIS|nr:phage protein Gp37 [Aquitalea magnusonii]MBA4709571.1 DUF1834 family protein [Aquitalea magnusonii]
MIGLIEDALISRLQQGLGELVGQVSRYGGELEDDLPAALGHLPAAWVSFDGVLDSKPHGTSRQQYRVQGQFVVLVGDCLAAGAAEGPGYRLVQAVRRLLSEQDLGLAISPLTPGKVRTLFNRCRAGEACRVLACEFACSWLEQALPAGGWPIPPSPEEDGAVRHPDSVFALAHGRTNLPDPPFLGIGIDYHLVPDDGVADARDILRRNP